MDVDYEKIGGFTSDQSFGLSLILRNMHEALEYEAGRVTIKEQEAQS